MTGLEYDPNPDNNQATFILNIPYVDPENQIPEVPSNLPDNGMATVPPIPNIEDLMDLDIYQPGPNPIPPNNPPNPPGPDTPGPNPPGPNPPGPNPPGPNPPNPPGPDTPDPNPPGPNPPNPGPNPNSSPGTWGGNDQLYRDQMYIRDTLSYVPTTGSNPPELPEWNLTIDPPEIDQWDIFDMLINAAGELLFLGTIASTPGANEYLQQVKTGISNGMKSIQTGLRYFTKDPRRAFDLIKRGFTSMGKSFVDDGFMKAVSDNTFKLDPNVIQEALVRGLCKIFPNQAAEIRTFFTILSSINFIKDPLGIYKVWGNVVYSLFTERIAQGNYETIKKFWEAIKKTLIPI